MIAKHRIYFKHQSIKFRKKNINISTLSQIILYQEYINPKLIWDTILIFFAKNNAIECKARFKRTSLKLIVFEFHNVSSFQILDWNNIDSKTFSFPFWIK